MDENQLTQLLEHLVKQAIDSREDNLHDLGYDGPNDLDETDDNYEQICDHLNDIVLLNSGTVTLERLKDMMGEDWVKNERLELIMDQLEELNEQLTEIVEETNDVFLDIATGDIRNALENIGDSM